MPRLRILALALGTTAIYVAAAWTTSAQAPSDTGRLELAGGRSIAQIQEESFDQDLSRYRHCYGIHVTYDNASDGRRRACKAMIVHKIGKALGNPGAYFGSPLHFECQNTAAGFTQWYDWKSNPVLKLKPNREYEVIDHAIANYLKVSTNSSSWIRAQKACDFYLECRDTLSIANWNFQNVKRCFWNSDSGVATRILQRELISLVFNQESDGLIIPRMLENEPALEDLPNRALAGASENPK